MDGWIQFEIFLIQIQDEKCHFLANSVEHLLTKLIDFRSRSVSQGAKNFQIQLLEELTIWLKHKVQRSLTLNFTNIKFNSLNQ